MREGDDAAMRDAMYAAPKNSSTCFFFTPPQLESLVAALGTVRPCLAVFPCCSQCVRSLNLAGDGAGSAMPQARAPEHTKSGSALAARTAQQ